MRESGRWRAAGSLCALLVACAATADAGDVEHRVAGVVPFPEHERASAAVGDPEVQRSRMPRPAWVDDRYWDELVFDALESSDYTARRTHALTEDQLLDLNIYIRTAAPEDGVDPISEDMVAWWRDAIPEAVRQFTGQPWRGTITTGTGARELDDGQVHVGIGTAEDFEDDDDDLRTCAFARTWSYVFPDDTFAFWGRTEILFNPDEGRCGFRTDSQGRVMAHELGHALGLFHVADPAALMYANTLPDQRYTRQLVDHAQLLYELGPGLPHPGFGPTVPDTTPDQWTTSVDQVAYNAARNVVSGRAWHNGAGQDVATERHRVVALFVDAANELIGENVRDTRIERTNADSRWEFELSARDGWERVFLVSVVFTGDTSEDGLLVDCTDAENRGRPGTVNTGDGRLTACLYDRGDIEVEGGDEGWTPGTATRDLADQALGDLQSQDDDDQSNADAAALEMDIEGAELMNDSQDADPVPALPLGGLGLLAGWLLLMGCQRLRSGPARRRC